MIVSTRSTCLRMAWSASGDLSPLRTKNPSSESPSASMFHCKTRSASPSSGGSMRNALPLGELCPVENCELLPIEDSRCEAHFGGAICEGPMCACKCCRKTFAHAAASTQRTSRSWFTTKAGARFPAGLVTPASESEAPERHSVFDRAACDG